MSQDILAALDSHGRCKKASILSDIAKIVVVYNVCCNFRTLIGKTLTGRIYLAKQHHRPFAQLAIYPCAPFPLLFRPCCVCLGCVWYGMVVGTTCRPQVHGTTCRPQVQRILSLKDRSAIQTGEMRQSTLLLNNNRNVVGYTPYVCCAVPPPATSIRHGFKPQRSSKAPKHPRGHRKPAVDSWHL